MIRPSPLPQVGLSFALGVLLASAPGPARAAWEPRVEIPAGPGLELIAPERAAELPPELRAPTATSSRAPSHADALGLREDGSSHQVQLHWVVREHGGVAGYRVTLAAADGLPGNLAARWWVAPATGVALGNGLTAYSTAVSLTLDEPAPVAAAVEAIDRDGHPILLGVRRSVAKPEPNPRRMRAAASDKVSADSTALQASRLLPSPSASASSAAAYSVCSAAFSAPTTPLPASLAPGCAVWPRGPPTVPVTT